MIRTAKIVHTTCVMDCPDTCALEVVVDDGRIQRIGGAQDHPTTNGFICDKVSRFARRVYHGDRLLYPMRRRGPKGAGEFVRISWVEAMAEITSRFREIIRGWGSEAILPYHYGGSNGLLSDGWIDAFYFARLGASRLARTLCAAPTTEVAMGMYGKMPGVAFEDYRYAKFILICGANPKVSNIHLVPFLRQAKRNGAFVAVVDPLKNFSSHDVDLHVPVFPGADLPVALAMIRIWKEAGRLDRDFLRQHADGLGPLLEEAHAWPVERAAQEARVAPQDIRILAEVYAESTPAVIRCGWGLERNRNGGQAIAAILAMPALLGKFGVRGGGYTLSNSGAAKLDTTKIFGDYAWPTRMINMTQLGEVLNGDLQPPIKGLFVYNCNPAVTAPHQNAILRGLAREDLFTVVFEQVMTDTAKYADILLPATTFLEHQDIRRAYGSYVVGGVQPVIPALGEAKSNGEVFAALGRAMGWQDEPFFWDTHTSMQKVADALTLHGRPASAGIFTAGETQPYDFPGPTPIQFKTAFPQTPDGKIHLTPPALGSSPFHYRPVKSDGFPLAMISPATSKMITSTLGEFNFPELWLTLHPRDASARGIAEGDTVRVFNGLGEVICRARVSERVRESVVSLPKGAWRKSSMNGRTSTALCPADVNEVGGGACYNDARVDVEKLKTTDSSCSG
ncbi:MAG: molybdopterin-dependent oxidoreductase [Acidobacteria bacterium]|nr:molybdopterin-dependent oxidoreductase [Acidobacteriota bacterium]